MNNKGSLVLRDVVIMLFLASGVVIFASVFVSEMATTYGDTEMQDEFKGSAFNIKMNDSFYSSEGDVASMANATRAGLGGLIAKTFTTAKTVLETVFLAPNTFGDMIQSTLEGMRVPSIIYIPLGIIIKTLLYILVIFVIISAFLQGGKM